MLQDWIKEEEEEGEAKQQENLNQLQVEKKWLKKIWRLSRNFVEYVIE